MNDALKDLITTETTLVSAAQDKVTKGDTAKPVLARYQAILDQITSVQNQRLDAVATAGAQLTTAMSRGAAVSAAAATTQLKGALKALLKTPAEVDALPGTDTIKNTPMAAPLDNTKTYDFYRTDKSAKDAAAQAAQVAAAIARINAEAKLKIVGVQLEALLAGVGQIAACESGAEDQFGAARAAIGRGDVGSAYASLYRGLRALADVAATPALDTSALDGACDDYGTARGTSITAEDTLATKAADRAAAADKLKTANAQLAAALAAKAK